MMVCNSLALKLAGITKETPDPPGGVIVQDAAGEPTGVLKDAAMDLVVEGPARPARRPRSWRRCARPSQHAAKNGVTSVQDLPGLALDLAAWDELRNAGELTVRVNYRPSLTDWQRRESRADLDEAGRVAQGRAA